MMGLIYIEWVIWKSEWGRNSRSARKLWLLRRLSMHNCCVSCFSMDSDARCSCTETDTNLTIHGQIDCLFLENLGCVAYVLLLGNTSFWTILCIFLYGHSNCCWFHWSESCSRRCITVVAIWQNLMIRAIENSASTSIPVAVVVNSQPFLHFICCKE